MICCDHILCPGSDLLVECFQTQRPRVFPKDSRLSCHVVEFRFRARVRVRGGGGRECFLYDLRKLIEVRM